MRFLFRHRRREKESDAARGGLLFALIATVSSACAFWGGGGGAANSIAINCFVMSNCGSQIQISLRRSLSRALLLSPKCETRKQSTQAKVIKNAFIQLFTRKSFIIMKLTISWRVAAGDCIINWNDLRRIEIEHFNFFFSCLCCSLFHLIYDVANQALME